MAIVFGGDTGLRTDSFSNFLNGMVSQFKNFSDTATNSLWDAFSGVNVSQRPIKENVYIDDGFQSVPGISYPGSKLTYIQDIKTRRVNSQEPQFTIFIKKRAFSSLKEANDTRFLDTGEKLYLRAAKILFENKCAQISSYEALTKMEQLISEESELDVFRIAVLADLVNQFLDSTDSIFNQSLTLAAEQAAQDAANGLGAVGVQTVANLLGKFDQFKRDSDKLRKLSQILDQVKQMALKGKQATSTMWVIDPDNSTDIYNIGRGSGVIELTLVNGINTGLSLEYGDLGNISFAVQDPYQLTNINANDIETALTSAYLIDNLDINTNTQQTSAQIFLDQARQKEQFLRTVRADRLSNFFGANGGDYGEITFTVNASSSAPVKVVASMSALNQSFNENNYRIVLSQIQPEFRLTYQEDQLVSQIFKLLNDYITQIERQSNQVALNNNNPDIAYARRNLRLHYLGKHIVQPMDEVSVFVRSKNIDDGDQIGPVNSLLNGSGFVNSYIQNYMANDDELIEEIKNFNLDQMGMPVDLYRLLRTQSFLRNAGAHIFRGLIERATENYSVDTGYVLDVSGKNNLKYLNNSRVTESPSLDQSRSFLEDPLSPFTFDPDPSTGLITGQPKLIQANVDRLNNSKLVFSTGINKGKFFTQSEDPIGQLRQNIVTVGQNNYDVFQHIPGLVYKWKQGIISISANINLRNNLNGTGLDSDRLKREIGLTVTTSPFANLDIADVVSILVTGAPHNYESFVLSTKGVGTYSFGDPSNSPKTYFGRFFDIFQTQNRTQGAFQAFKPLKIDQKQLSKRLELQVSITQNSEQLSSLQSQLALVQDQLNLLDKNPNQTQLSGGVVQQRRIASLKLLQQQQSSITTKINSTLSSIQKNIHQAGDYGYNVYGSQLIKDLSQTTSDSSSTASEQSNDEDKSKLRYMQQRTQLDVKYNQDKNLFIVDDTYDKDLDLQAFVLNLKSGEQPLFDTTFKVPLDICINAARTINFEFFCNTQGHIELRPPQYNRTPLTLLLRMMQTSDQSNINIFPPFLRSLFQNQQASISNELKIIDLELQDASILLNIPLPAPSSFTIAELGQNFSSTLVGENNKSVVQPQAADVTGLLDVRNQRAALTGDGSLSETPEVLDQLAAEINSYQNANSSNVNANRLTKFGQITQLLSRQQQLELTLSQVNAQNQAVIDGIGQRGISFNTPLTPQLAKTLFEPFSDLIEDDITDYIGPGSSKRFIITDDKIISYSLSETDDLLTRVDVTGQIDFLGEQQDGNVAGVPTIWAGATDFDLWKQYGWRSNGAVNVPFFKDSELQCAPYAVMLLTRQRKDIVKGSITVVGNEYYQLGDVVYVAPKDLLYYVTAVEHNFDYNGQYTTRLELRYGHPLGEYIPSPLDVIGKNLIKNYNKVNKNLTNRQTANQDIGVLLGVVAFTDDTKDSTDTSSSLTRKMTTGTVGALNLAQLKNALLVSNLYATNEPNTFPKVEIRGYYINIADQQTTQSRINVVLDWLMSPFDGFDQDGNQIPLDPINYIKLSKKQISSNTTPIDLSKEEIEQSVIDRSAFPKEELYNLSKRGAPDEGIEIVLVYG